LYGGSLARQSDYVALCVERILAMYNGQRQSLVVVGHSIGGMVARSLFVRPNFDASKVSILLTLATPHSPVLVADAQTRTFYDLVDTHWKANRTKTGSLKDVTFISVGGGERDVQVRSSLTHSPHADVNVISTASPGTWVSTDHRCIAWCKQLVLALNRALFDSVDRAKNDITGDADHRRQVFRYHMLDRSRGKRFKKPLSATAPKKQTFDKDGFWSDSLKRQFVFERKKVAVDSHVLIRVIDDAKHQDVVIDTLNIYADSWLFGCKATTVYKNIRLCESGEDLSHLTQLLPSSSETLRKTASANLHQLAKEKGFTHLLVYVPKGSQHVRVHIDVFNGENQGRFISVELPRWITFWKPYTLVEETHPEALFYNLSMKGLDEPWQAYDVKVTRLNKCKDHEYYGIMKFVTPWANDSYQTLIGPNVTNKLTARLQSTKPAGDDQYFRDSEMHLHLSPTCQYRLQIQVNLPRMWGQIVRFYAPLLLPFSAAVVLLTLTQQLKALALDGYCPSFLTVITSRVTPISVVMPSKLLSFLVSTAFASQFIPKTDYTRLTEEVILILRIIPLIMMFQG
jgi:glycosylphosphatidylinositol deacylase